NKRPGGPRCSATSSRRRPPRRAESQIRLPDPWRRDLPARNPSRGYQSFRQIWVRRMRDYRPLECFPLAAEAPLASNLRMTLVLVSDLLFSSKITTAAKGLGVAVKVIRDPGALRSESGDLVIVDLNQPGTLEAAIAWKSQHAGQVI